MTPNNESQPVAGPPLLLPSDLTIDVAEDRRRATGRFVPGSAQEGPPGHVHGGVSAAVLDVLTARLAGVGLGQRVVTARLDLRFRRALALHTQHLLVAELVRVSGRRARVHGAITGPDGTVEAEADALFVVMPTKSES